MMSVRGVARAAALVAAVVLLAAGAVQAITIDTVPVGNLGNAADTHGAGYGTVNYDYKIGKYEVTAGQYTEFLNKVAATDTYGLYNTNMLNTSGIARSVGDPYAYTVDANFANRPVTYVSFWDAARFSNWLHNGQPTGLQVAGTTERGAYTLDGYNGTDGRTIQRSAGATWAITSEDEWYKAAYHDKTAGLAATYFDYPTSSNTAPGRDMADPLPGNNANYYTDSGACPIDSPYYTTRVGEFQNSDSPYGTFDQGGNVIEWNEAIDGQDETYAYRGLRGGSFGTYDFNLLAAFRSYIDPTFEVNNFGFRVSEVPEPATLTLLAVGGLMALRRRR
jgi:sulfatase modifying factor 1